MRNTEELCGITTRKAAWYEQKKCETYVNDDLSDAGITGIPTSIFSIRNTTNMALTEYESAMDSGYNTEIKSEVQTVIAVLQAEYDKSQAGELTEEEAKAEAKEIVRAMRYRDDGSGYFWIDDTDYNLVMHPILAEQEGNNRYDLEDQNGVMIIQEGL